MEAKQQILFDFDAAEEIPTPPQIAPAEAAPQAPPPKKRGRKPRDPSLIIKKEPAKRGRKSLKEAAAAADLIEIPEDDILFRKQYYTMGEVTRMFRVNHSQIRLWESEFSILQPKKNKKGDRYFRPVDIKNLHLIHNLIRIRKFTIEGAREFLKNSGGKADTHFEMIRSLEKIKGFLLEIKAQL